MREHKTNPSVLELQRRMDGRSGTEDDSTWAERKFIDINAEIRLIRCSKDTQDSNLENKLAQTVSAMQGLNEEIKEELELLVRYDVYFKCLAFFPYNLYVASKEASGITNSTSH